MSKPVKPKRFCPLRKSIACPDASFWDGSYKVTARCAWWMDDVKQCALATVAQVLVRVREELDA